MTIKELKQKIMPLDDNMRVGGIGYFGEFLDCLEVGVETVSKGTPIYDEEVIFRIVIEDAGDEPC